MVEIRTIPRRFPMDGLLLSYRSTQASEEFPRADQPGAVKLEAVTKELVEVGAGVWEHASTPLPFRRELFIQAHPLSSERREAFSLQTRE